MGIDSTHTEREGAEVVRPLIGSTEQVQPVNDCAHWHARKTLESYEKA
jgi:hypothetical protein